MVTLRGNCYQLYKRVPKRYACIESRGFVWLSLHTDSKSVAEAKAIVAWAQMIEAWEARLAGDQGDAVRRFDAATELAAVRGFRYLAAAKVSELPLDELLKRVSAVPSVSGIPDRIEAAAILGGASMSGITVSAALNLYWTLAGDKVLGKSEDQLRRWRNPRIKAVKNFVKVVGDKAIEDISGDDMLNFREWWLERIRDGEVSANAANKDLIHLGDVLKTVNKMKRLGLVLPLTDLGIKPGEAGTRPPFTEEWIRDRLLAPNALAGLNPEARAIFLAMINTGARPSELAALTPECIRLASDIPHISIEAIGRQMKSANAKRIIPLAGVSLEALRDFPDGFPRYRNSSASLSSLVNKFLRNNDLTETPNHTMYGLRHGFEDRMLAVGVDERIRRDLLGHALKRERYGTGATLKHMLELVSKVAL